MFKVLKEHSACRHIAPPILIVLLCIRPTYSWIFIVLITVRTVNMWAYCFAQPDTLSWLWANHSLLMLFIDGCLTWNQQ